MEIVHKKTCTISNGRYRAIFRVMLQCPTTNLENQIYDIAQTTVTFTIKDGIQLNRTCIGQGELPSCKTKMIRPDIIRCVYKAESKKCTPPTTTITTPIPMGTKASDTITCATTTISSKPSVTASSGPASDTACSASTTTTDTTASDTPTGTTTPGSASSKTASGTDGSQTGVIVGGVVGGLFGGVVFTVVIVFLCHACRSERRHTEDEDGAGAIESCTCLGLIHTTSSSGKSPPGTNAGTSQVRDVRVSAVQQASSAPSDVYDVIKEGDDNQLGVDPSVCDQGDYMDITDDVTGAGVYSLAQTAPGMAAQGGTPLPAAEYFVLEKDDPTDGDYNKLVRDGASETGCDVQGTYNRLGRDGATETTTDVQGTYNRLVRDGATETTTDVQGTYNSLVRDGATERGTDVQGTYNRLVRDGATETTTDVQGTCNRLVRGGATETTTDVQGTYNRLVRGGATETTTDMQDTYNKFGSMADDNEDNEPGGKNGTAADCFILEKPEDTYNKLEGKRYAEEEQEPYTKLGEATPKRVRTP